MFNLDNMINNLFIVAIAILVAVVVLGSIRMAQEYQRAVIFRFGRLVGTRGPGLFFKLPFAERAVFVDMRTVTRQREMNETITRDGVAVKVNAVLRYQVSDPVKSFISVVDWSEVAK